MWIMSIKVPYMEDSALCKFARKFGVTIYGYPISHKIVKNVIYLNASCILVGKKDKIIGFVKEFAKHPQIIKWEFKDNRGIALIKQDISNKYLYEPEIMHLKPAIVDREGNYLFELCSWTREPLINILNAYKKFKVELIYIKEQKNKHFSIMTPFANLTEKQKNCYRLAVDKGYYSYPRKIHLEDLAKLAKISYSTFQFHLRKAENKILSDIKI